jgi:DNA-binding XRE family transcriptional regulator
MAENKEFSFERFEQLQRKLGITLSCLAKALGLSRATIYTWRDKGALRVDSAHKVRTRMRIIHEVTTANSWNEMIRSRTQQYKERTLLALMKPHL